MTVAERWLPVAGYDGYEVSDLGRVRSWKVRGGTRAAEPSQLRPARQDGRRYVSLSRPGSREWRRPVSQLVLEAFVGPRPPGAKLCARHLSGDVGDDRLANLAWGTHAEALHDRVRAGHARPRWSGADNPNAALSREQADEVRALLAGGARAADLCARYCVSETVVRGVKAGRSYR